MLNGSSLIPQVGYVLKLLPTLYLMGYNLLLTPVIHVVGRPIAGDSATLPISDVKRSDEVV